MRYRRFVRSSGVSIFQVFGDSTYLLSKECLRSEQVSRGHDGTAAILKLELLRLPSVVPEYEHRFPIATRLGAEEGKLAARVKVDSKLEAFRGEFCYLLVTLPIHRPLHKFRLTHSLASRRILSVPQRVE